MKKFMMFLMIASAGMCFAFSDSPDTVGLWHCNSMFEVTPKFYTPDDDSVMVGRNYDLELKNGLALTSTPGVDGTGYALDFDGVNDYGMKLWGQYDNIKVEFYFKADTLSSEIIPPGTVANKYFVEVAGIFRLYLNADNVLVMTVWDTTTPVAIATTQNLATTVVVGQWYKVEASYDSTGLFRLFLYDAAGNTVDAKQGIYGNGTMAKSAAAVNFILGSYRGNQYFFDGQIDEVKVSNYVYPTWAMPYQDQAATVLALWHFDALADPNTSGVTYKLMPDDDSDNPGRGRDLKLYSGTGSVPANNGESAGPAIVDPAAAGIGYPAGSASFGNCAFFNDPFLVEGGSFRMLNAALPIDPTNVRVDCWIRPATDLINYVPGGTLAIPYFIVDRWGQLTINLSQATTGALSISATPFGSSGLANDTKAISASYATLGIDPYSWVNVSFRFYQGKADLYINGILGATKTLTTNSLKATPTNPEFYIGKRYKTYTNYFWGYMDEMKISQAVYSVGCGALGYLLNDFDKDCFVGVSDLKLLADQWLDDAITPSVYESVDTGTYEQYATYNIPMASVTPTIDGTLSAGEWADAKEIYLAMPELTTAPNVGSQKYIIPTSHDDFSGYYYMKWDATYLYVGIKVIDEVLMFDAGYPDDHVTLAFNPLNAGTLSADVALYNMYRDYFGASQIVNSTGFNAAFNPVNAVKANATQADGWSFEVAYKWSDFGGYTPTVGAEHGVAIMICDNDVVDVPSDLRDTFLFDSGSGDTTVLGEPSLYRTATLTSGIVCGDNGYMSHDIGQDCDVNLLEYASMADSWLECTDPMTTGCVDAR